MNMATKILSPDSRYAGRGNEITRK